MRASHTAWCSDVGRCINTVRAQLAFPLSDLSRSFVAFTHSVPPMSQSWLTRCKTQYTLHLPTSFSHGISVCDENAGPVQLLPRTKLSLRVVQSLRVSDRRLGRGYQTELHPLELSTGECDEIPHDAPKEKQCRQQKLSDIVARKVV